VAVSAALVLSLEDPRWAEFVARSPGATPFHHPAWAQLLAVTYRYRGFVIAVADDDDQLVAGAPFIEVHSLSGHRRWISLPFTDECPLLANDPACAQQLVTSLAGLRPRLRAPTLEVRGLVDGFGWRAGADAVIHELDLDADIDHVKRQFSRSQVIRNIARAEREAVVVRRATNASDLEAFYALHADTRRRQGVPVQPRRFFELLWSRLVEPGIAHILLADADGHEAAAGALFLSAYGTTIYKFGASTLASRPQRPNHLIFSTAIQDACARRDRRFDFGRTDLGNEGLRAFKHGWGAQERPLRYSTLSPGAGALSEGLPARALSAAIRRGPGWVCRGTGEALYRYAASR
jgi:CelD/BcsL family acetyltransferase involved in cellulose biosynthesis